MNDLEELVRRFEDGSWPVADWHHRQHLMVATWYLSTLPFDAAQLRIREGIQAYNKHQGIEQTLKSGYHETLTIALIRLIRHEIAAAGPMPLAEVVERVCRNLSDWRVVRKHYSRERIMTWEARTTWVEPDLEPLP